MIAGWTWSVRAHLTFILQRTFELETRGAPPGIAQLFWTFKFAFAPSHVHAEGQIFAEKIGCRFVETSAKLGTNVTETFIDLVCEIRDRNRVGFSFLFGAAFFSVACPLSYTVVRLSFF